MRGDLAKCHAHGQVLRLLNFMDLIVYEPAQEAELAVSESMQLPSDGCVLVFTNLAQECHLTISSTWQSPYLPPFENQNYVWIPNIYFFLLFFSKLNLNYLETLIWEHFQLSGLSYILGRRLKFSHFRSLFRAP